MAQDIKYNNNSLQTSASPSATILTRDIQYQNLASKSLITREDTIRHGYELVDEHYTSRTITVSGWLISDTGSNLKTLVDTFKSYFNDSEGNLDIETYGGSTVYRRHIATLQNLEIPEEHWMVTQLPFTLTFMCQPFSMATSTTTVNLNSGNPITSSPYNEGISISGTYNTKPVITITVNSETSMTVLKLDNTTTGDWIQITPSGGFSAGDVLEIDCENETIELNSSSIDFTGVFPVFESGTNNLTLTITASAFNLDASIVYYPNYL